MGLLTDKMARIAAQHAAREATKVIRIEQPRLPAPEPRVDQHR